METLIFLVGVTAIVALNALLAFTLGWLFTEVVRLPLNFKPFTCRPCLTFWFTVVLGIVLALILTPYFPGVESLVAVDNNGVELGREIYYGPVRIAVTFGLIGVGILVGFINFLYIKLKFRIYD